MRTLFVSIFLMLFVSCKDFPNDSTSITEVSKPASLNIDSIFHKYDVKGIDLDENELEFLIKEDNAKNLKQWQHETLKEIKRNR